MKRWFRPFMLCAALVLSQQGAHAADIYGYIDSKGVAHFASEKIDERYQIFFRGGQSFDTAKGISPLGRGARGIDGKVPQASQTLLAMFEASPGYKTAKAALRDASSKHAIDYELLQALVATESGFDAQAVSPKGAMGLMQLMPATWAEMRAAHRLGPDPHDPRDNILAGTAYLRAMYDRFGYPGLFAAYNAGPSRYAEHLTSGRRLPGETVAYVAATGASPVRGFAARRRSEPPLVGPGTSDIFVALVGARRDFPGASPEPAATSMFVPLRMASVASQ